MYKRISNHVVYVIDIYVVYNNIIVSIPPIKGQWNLIVCIKNQFRLFDNIMSINSKFSTYYYT